MKWFRSLAIAFSMYSSIPMPRVDWNQENMRYALCFFPLVGVVTGGGLWLLSWGCSMLSVGHVLFAVLAVLLPIAVNGGIHLDGLCDTADALASHQTRERKLEILKDSHTGAFAVISCVVYLLLQFGLWSEVERSWSALGVLSAGFVLSRSLSAFSIAGFPCAKNSGLAATFSDAAQKRAVRGTAVFFWVICTAAMLWSSPVLGAGALVAAGLSFLYYRVMSMRQFGGITGDLAGYFLQVCEISMLLAVVLLQKIQGVLL